MNEVSTNDESQITKGIKSPSKIKASSQTVSFEKFAKAFNRK